MSTDRDVTRVVRSWLHEDAYEDADRVLNEVVNALDTTPQRRRRWLTARRPIPMSTFMRVGASVAAIAAIAALAFTLLPRANVANPGNTPSPTPTPLQFPQGDTSTGGRYAVRLPHAPLDAVMTLPPGWTSSGWYVVTQASAVAFFTPANVYRDACDQDAALPSPAVGVTVDDFLTALDAQANSDMTPPVDVKIGGMDAKRFELKPSAGAPCDVVRWWAEPCCGDPAFRGAETGPEAQTDPDVVWVMNVDGQLVAVVGYWHHSQTAVGAEIDGMVRSLAFAPH